jgi:hypothetical protein
MFQIAEDDLETMEAALPKLQEALMGNPSGEPPINRKDVNEHLQMLKSIVSNVRWNYGPPVPGSVEIIL